MCKDECKEEYNNKSLYMTEEKCDKCEYYYKCPYMMMAWNDVVYGDMDW